MLSLDALLDTAYAGQAIQVDYSAYEVDFLEIAAGAAATGSLTVSADSDFVIMAINQITDLAGAAIVSNAKPVPLATVQFVDTSAGRYLFDTAIPLPSIAGDGSEPFYLPCPRLLPAKTVLQTNFVNYSAATEYNTRISFIGMRVYRKGPSPRVQDRADILPLGVQR